MFSLFNFLQSKTTTFVFFFTIRTKYWLQRKIRENVYDKKYKRKSGKNYVFLHLKKN